MGQGRASQKGRAFPFLQFRPVSANPIFCPTNVVYLVFWIASTIFLAIALLTPFKGMMIVTLIFPNDTHEGQFE